MLAVSVTFTIQDRAGDTSTTKIKLPNGFSIQEYVETGQAFAALIADAIDGVITSVGLCIGVETVGLSLKAFAATASKIGRKATFIFNSTVAGFRKVFNIPAWDESKSLPGDEVDLSDTDVAVLDLRLEQGYNGLGGVVQWTDSRANDLSSLSKAYESFRNVG